MKIFQENDLLESYSKDWLGRSRLLPVGVCYPEDDEDLKQVVKIATLEKLNIKIRGGNTSLSGQTLILSKNTLVVDTCKLKPIIKIEGDIVRVSSGYTLFEVNDFLKKYDRVLPLHMGSYQSATIGGITSTNAGGMHAWKYGMARNLITEIKFILPNLEFVREATTSLKNNSLIGLSDVIIGGEGKLGIISEVSLRTFPKNDVNCGILVSQNSWDKLLEAFHIIELNLINEVEICEFLVKPTFIESSLFNSEFNLLIGLNPSINSDSLEEKLEIILKLLDEDINQGIFWLNKRQYSDSIKFREALPVKHAEIEKLEKFDLKIAREKIPALYDMLLHFTSKENFSYFGHFLDGNVHLNISKTHCNEEFINSISNLVLSEGGSFSAEHGIGFFKKSHYLNHKHPKSIELNHFIKNHFDPNDLFD